MSFTAMVDFLYTMFFLDNTCTTFRQTACLHVCACIYTHAFLSSGPDRGQSPIDWGDFPFVRPFVCLSVHPPLRAKEPARQTLDPSRQASEPARQASEPLRPGWLAMSTGWLALRPAWLVLKPAWLGLRTAWLAPRPFGGITDGWMDKRMHQGKISDFQSATIHLLR